ncbi:coniferyl alcohol acyltransferase-like [Mangifera indica]|uniref:coniferyl alcohol acyltransferase-like n=1 Tax=Mangifera indica TaxID=29780 RepID=UPI001CF9DC94|nr:coniferyl alcohol acyltransferase-like [Mangifera indica]
MVAGGEFKVTVSKTEVVAAVLPLQEHWLPLSNLDLLLPPVDVSVFFCFHKPSLQSMTFASMVAILKKALAQTLVSYYALAGEVVLNPVGEPELLCNNRGVDFVEAFANVELSELNLYNPDESIQGKLVPNKKNGVLSIQATELNCSGVVVACTFDHRIADAYSINMFLVSWAELAQSKPMSLLPSFRRSVLNPRRPGCIDPALDDMYVPLSPSPSPKEPVGATHDDHLISRIYYVTKDQLNELQSLASANGCRRTKLESFSAFLWKMIAKCGATNSERTSKLGIVVDGRSRLSQGDSEKSRLMGAYFGNVLSIPIGGQKIIELEEKPLSFVANQVHAFLENAVTQHHFLALIDWVEAHRPQPALAKIYINGTDDGPAFVVSSGQRFPVSRVDFGWGKPAFGSYHFPWGGDAGYVMPMPSPLGNGDWVVYLHLLKKQLQVIEREASNVFRPLTADYLNLMK